MAAAIIPEWTKARVTRPTHTRRRCGRDRCYTRYNRDIAREPAPPEASAGLNRFSPCVSESGNAWKHLGVTWHVVLQTVSTVTRTSDVDLLLQNLQFYRSTVPETHGLWSRELAGQLKLASPIMCGLLFCHKWLNIKSRSQERREG